MKTYKLSTEEATYVLTVMGRAFIEGGDRAYDYALDYARRKHERRERSPRATIGDALRRARA